MLKWRKIYFYAAIAAAVAAAAFVALSFLLHCGDGGLFAVASLIVP